MIHTPLPRGAAGALAASLALALAAARPPAFALAQRAELPAAPIEIVLDASGRMGGPYGETDRMALAKEFVRVLRAELAAGGTPPPPLGLRLYGADTPRAQRDCRDTRLAVRPADPEADLAVALAAVQPLGASPLAFALQSALADSARTYVLITRGADGCGGDACGAWREAAAGSHRDTRIHVVALGPEPEDVERLRCLSRAGRGTLIVIEEAAQIGRAAQRLGLILKNQGLLDVRLSIGAEPFAAPVRLLVPRTRQVVAAFPARGPRAVPAGIYTVVVETAPPITVERVMVLPGETATIERTDFGRLLVEARDAADQPLRAPVTVRAAGRRAEVRYGSSGDPFVLQAGSYDVFADLGDSLAARRGVVVAAGRATRLVFGGRGTVRVVSPEFAEPPPTRAILSRGGGADTLPVGEERTLPAGRYRLTVETLPVYVSDEIVVAADETTTVELPPLGVLWLELAGPDGPITGLLADVVEPLTHERYGSIPSGARRLLMPGTYRLRLATAPPLAVEDVVVRPGAETVVERHGLSRIAVTPLAGAPASLYHLEVWADRRGPRLAEATGAAPVVYAWPGAYFARVSQGPSVVWEGRVAVASDKPARIDLPRP